MDSFVSHIESDAYGDTIFHRVSGIRDSRECENHHYVFWYCGFTASLQRHRSADISNTCEGMMNLTHGPGTLAWPSRIDSAGSQFYIVRSD